MNFLVLDFSNAQILFSIINSSFVNVSIIPPQNFDLAANYFIVHEEGNENDTWHKIFELPINFDGITDHNSISKILFGVKNFKI